MEMMDFVTMIQEYAVLPVALLCFIVGYGIKHYITVVPNNLIPLILTVLGVGCVVWINMAFSFELLLSGVCSAALAVLVHQMGVQLKAAKEGD